MVKELIEFLDCHHCGEKSGLDGSMGRVFAKVFEKFICHRIWQMI